VNIEKGVPLEKLRWFESLLGVDESSFEALGPYRGLFAAANDAFAADFSDRLRHIPEARIYLDHQRHEGYLRQAWAGWFFLLFDEGFTDRFLAYQWKSGLRHVEVGMDHRFIALGYSYLRQFCQKIIADNVPVEERETLLHMVDKMVDLCLLVETQAFVEATTQCDAEVVRGVSHQVRNPLTVIGGNIARLKRKAPPNDPVHATYDILIEESERLEGMVNDAAAYSEMFRKETVFSRISLRELISEALEKVRERHSGDDTQIVFDLDPEASEVYADRADMSIMFFHLLENSFESLDRARPLVRIVSRRRKEEPAFVEVEVFNTGRPPSADEIVRLFAPFSSTEPFGTGLGLSIVRLAARRNLGEVFLEPVPGEGMRSVVKLPAAVVG
jgi:signal transduction histidine kinase